MFYLIKREEVLVLKPRFVNKHLQANIFSQLRSKVEGKVTGRYGFTIAVTKLNNFGQGGVIDVVDASVHFRVQFECLVFRPFVGDVLMSKVISISSNGVHLACGPLQIFVHKNNICKGSFTYDDSEPALPKFVRSDMVISLNDFVRSKILSDRNLDESPLCVGEIIENQG